MFANSSAETKTTTESAFLQGYANMMGNIGAIVSAVAAAVFFTMLLVTANAMAQSVRERVREIAVMRTIGFSNGGIVALVLLEGLGITMIGGALGLWSGDAAARSIGARLTQYLPLMFMPPNAFVIGALLAVGLGALSCALPCAADQFVGLSPGSQLRQGTNVWNVVGVFADNGSVSESEIWSDAIVLQGVYNRGTSYQSTRVRLESAAALQTFKDALTSDPRVNVRVLTERQYYGQQARALVALVSILGSAIAVLMGIAAIFGALNTMYSAVASRTKEIATLRAIGFSAFPVVTSVLVEALFLGLIGGVIGGAIAYVGFNGLRASTMNLSSFSSHSR
jgi:ABC-type antimicrobial peptide transport system permease subunit